MDWHKHPHTHTQNELEINIAPDKIQRNENVHKYI